jgi:segregation and condensation protein B
MKMEDKKKIEAVLFAVGDKIEEEEISRLTRLEAGTVKSELAKLKDDYAQSGSTFILLNEGTKWKLTVREDYMPIVQKIVPKTELSRPVMETLAVIAWKSPVLQSDIINIRSTKGYDHIAELVDVGFITKQKYGRSFMLRLAQQFFEYFDVKDKAKIKEIFKDVKGADDIQNQDKTLQEFAGNPAEPSVPMPEIPAIVPAEGIGVTALPVEAAPAPEKAEETLKPMVPKMKAARNKAATENSTPDAD